MRKVTGYIGALIIVMALMGSILAGYALNINGQSAVVNEYEEITDVSGLYTHTSEKTYIDYNPASNYIGYSEGTHTYDNTFNTTNHYKKLNGGTVTISSVGTVGVWINGTYQGMPAFPWYAFVCDHFYVYFEGGGNLAYYGPDTVGNLKSITITFDPAPSFIYVTRVLSDDTVENLRLPRASSEPAAEYMALAYCTDGYDYGSSWVSGGSAYLNDKKDIICTTLGNLTNGFYTVIWGDTQRWLGNSTYVGTVNFVTETNDLGGGVSEYTINNLDQWGTFYPISVTAIKPYGIEYTESNRVNNYPLYTDGSTATTTSYQTINMEQISVTDYAGASDYYWNLGDLRIYDSTPTARTIQFTSPYTTDNNGSYTITGKAHIYRLSDVLSTISLPAGTSSVHITAPSSNISATGRFYVSGIQNPESYNFYLPDNFLLFSDNANLNGSDKKILDDNTLTGRYVDYYPATGEVYIYKANGTLISQTTANGLYLQWCDGNSTSGNTYENGTQGLSYTTSARSAPFINLTITSAVSGETPHYMNITKGVSIDPTNQIDTNWNNGYENGTIDIVFRAEDVNGTYHNDITVLGNTISIDYNGGRYAVTLNSAPAVDIGTWRSIMLNIDLIKGEVSVNPVRTFNSYTNVVMDKATVHIGDLINAAPTTGITWLVTSNSFKFSVYSTNVFLNTYGVVMVNPSLNITDYFTDLNQFYRLDLFNFSMYGDSITVNGVTGTVSDNTVTFGDDVFIIKDLTITYADGHAYIEDSHISQDLGEITTNEISMAGVWYFETILSSGYTALKQIYTWDWEEFILDNTQFCIFYIGLAFVGLIVARRFCTLSIIDYAAFIVSIIIALSTQVIA